jgi:hypothetical protein
MDMKIVEDNYNQQSSIHSITTPYPIGSYLPNDLIQKKKNNKIFNLSSLNEDRDHPS